MNAPSISVRYMQLISVMMFLYIPVLQVKAESTSAVISNETVIINEVSGPPDTSSDSLVSYIDYSIINARAKSMKLTAVDDSPPYIDNTAFFLTHPHVEIPVTGLEKGRNYNLYIDFVRYKNKKVQFDGLLKIYIKDKFGSEQLIASVDCSQLSSDKIFSREIPFNLSYSGSFTIIIHEYSMNSGNWGIWDIIVTSKNIGDIELIKPETRPLLNDPGTKIFK